MKESDFRQRVCLALRPFDPVSVENVAHPGTPDINFAHGWLELKVADRWPLRVNSIFRLPHLTPQQRVWILRRWRTNQRAWLLLRVGHHTDPRDADYLLFDGPTVAYKLGNLTKAETISLALAVWSPRLDDEGLRGLLKP